MAKYALVTGGSRGIGRAVAVRLANAGYNILINYVSRIGEAEKTMALIREAGQDGEILQFDVASAEETRKVLEGWQARNPEEYIEVIVNNAGIRRDNIMALMPEDDWNRVLQVSLGGFFNVTQPLLAPMMRRKYGRIISMASVSGLMGMQGQANYSAAKAGIISASKALAKEIARKNITVNCVAPGFIKTDMTEGLDEATLCRNIPAGRFGTVEEVADVVAFLASPEASYVTGNVISINGGLYT